MADVIFYTASTLDGHLATSDHSLDWLFAVDSTEAPDLEAFASGIGAYVSGSSTYEWVLKNDNLVAEPEKWAGHFGSRPWFVFTSRELPVPEGADVRFVQGRPAEHISSLREAAGAKDIWLYGGGDLVGQFFDDDLLDRIEVSITPVTLGEGAPLLPRRIESDRLKLQSAEQIGQFAHLVYETVER